MHRFKGATVASTAAAGVAVGGAAVGRSHLLKSWTRTCEFVSRFCKRLRLAVLTSCVASLCMDGCCSGILLSVQRLMTLERQGQIPRKLSQDSCRANPGGWPWCIFVHRDGAFGARRGCEARRGCSEASPRCLAAPFERCEIVWVEVRGFTTFVPRTRQSCTRNDILSLVWASRCGVILRSIRQPWI